MSLECDLAVIQVACGLILPPSQERVIYIFLITATMIIHQLKSALLYDSNIYLIFGSDKTALVDTGTGFAAEPYIKEIKQTLGGKKLDIVFVTHCHYDHVGGLGRIIKEFHPDKIYAGRLDAECLRQGDSESTLGTKFGGKIEPMDVLDFNESDSVDLGECLLRCIETPGHTSGSISIIDEISGALFSGDTVFIDGVGNTSHPTGSSRMLVNSLEKLHRLNITGLYPGHGPTIKKNGAMYIERGLTLARCLHENSEV
ncbi:MAG: MBL fold metallo-hydrolase [archaeon]|nr:MBL fold metallo-hydrolase [archaeon]